MKFVLPTSICKICFEKIPVGSWLHLMNRNACVCSRCFRDFYPKFHEFRHKGAPVLAIYDYDQIIREKLYQVKGCYDLELASVFLSYFQKELQLKYRSYFLVPAPSWEGDNLKREFNHVEEIFKGIGLPYLNAFIKTENVKQADLNFDGRQKVKDRLRLLSDINVKGKKLLFVDDVMTSGATAQAAVEMLRLAGAKKVKILVMSKTQMHKSKDKKTFSDIQA